jgi:hypothetical protein
VCLTKNRTARVKWWPSFRFSSQIVRFPDLESGKAVIPAQAGKLSGWLDSRLRGNDGALNIKC